MGPSLLWHLGGGEGGIQHFMDTLMGPMAAMWATLGSPEMTPELERKLVEGVVAEANRRSINDLTAERDSMLLALEAVRARYQP